jgi:molybdopterin-guanine dinucleotide biosynthesis adapter protein
MIDRPAYGTATGGPCVVCVVGKKKSGKTTTVVGLVRELTLRGYCVMTAKHGHGFQLDTMGTDSWRHRHEAGAARVVMAGPEQVAVMGEWDERGEQELESLVSRYLSDADIVIAEGFKQSAAPRVEVFRRAQHAEPIYGTDPRADALYVAILTDTPGLEAAVPTLAADDPERFRRVASLIEEQLLGTRVSSSEYPSRPPTELRPASSPAATPRAPACASFPSD